MAQRDEYELTFAQAIANSEQDFFVLAFRNYVSQPDRNWSEVLHCDGASWKVVADLPDVWLTRLCAAGPGMVVGLDVNGAIYRCSPYGCQRLDINVPGANALIAFAAEVFYLVGDRGACHCIREGRSERIDLGVSKQLQGVWGAREPACGCTTATSRKRTWRLTRTYALSSAMASGSASLRAHEV